MTEPISPDSSDAPVASALTAPVLQVKPLPGRRFLVKWTEGAASGIEVFVDFGDDYPAQGEILVGGEAEFAVAGVTGTSLVSAKVKGIYLQNGQRVGALGPTYATLLLP